MSGARALRAALAAAAGALSVLGFEPFGVAALPIVALALLFWLWNGAPSARAAGRLGFAFGAGLFAAGVSWVFVALTAFGDMPPWVGVIATAGFCAYLSLWPALAGWVAVRCAPAGTAWRLAAYAGAWTAAEWGRGYVFTGFPWLAVGYAQVPGDVLAGYAPIGGVFLVSLACTALAACLAAVFDALARGRMRTVVQSVASGAAVCAAGAAFAHVAWVRPGGETLAVSLVQGNVQQEEKFDPALRERTFALYAGLVAQAQGRLVVLPESAFPMFASQVPDAVIVDLVRAAAARDGAVLLGLFTAEPPLAGNREPRYYNTVAALAETGIGLYRKRHLVPFGESIPLQSLIGPLLDQILAIPLANQTSGDADQPPFAIAGTRVAVNICYEDAFGSELIAAAREAGILVNMTNDAWYGRSIAAWQHNQIAAMRALELGRPMLRATNTGVTSVVGVDGHERARLPWFTRGVLETRVTPYTGETPFVRFGDLPAIGAALGLVVVAGLWTRRRSPRSVRTGAAPATPANDDAR